MTEITARKPKSLSESDSNQSERGLYGRCLYATAKWFAMVGGMIFIGLVVMSIISIIGRKLFSAPVPGDVEVLQMAAAFASATFFAHCHLMYGDVKVDFFTARMPSTWRYLLDAIGSCLVGVVGALLAWRSGVGAVSLLDAGESSAVLELPVWAAQALMVPSFVLLALAGFYMGFQFWNRRGADA